MKFPKAQKSLSQGTIFAIDKLIFINGTRKLTFGTMYPEAKFTNVKYGIVLSQSCDLVNEDGRSIETPYIIIGLLDPMSRYVEEHLEEKIKKIIHDHSIDFPVNSQNSRKLTNEDFVVEKVSKELKRFFQNNEKFFFFVNFKNKKKSEMYSLNLTKTFPIKALHSDQILSSAKYQLKPSFENKLGWKLAEVFGRVGTQDYENNDLIKLTKSLLDEVGSKYSFGEGIPIDDADFKKAKSLISAKEEKRTDYFVELMTKKEKESKS